MLSTTDRVSIASALNHLDLDLRALTGPGLGIHHHISHFWPEGDEDDR